MPVLVTPHRWEYRPPLATELDGDRPPASGLAGAFYLLEGAGNLAYNHARPGVAGAGTLTAGPTWDALGGLAFVAASSQYVTLPTAPVFNNNGPASVAGWYRTTSTTLNLTVYAEGNTGNASPILSLAVNAPAAGNLRAFLRDSANTNPIAGYTATAVNDGKWHHVAAVSTGAGGTLTLYLDGVSVASASNTASTTAPFNAPAIGALIRTTTSQFFDGSLDAAKTWTRALTAAEVAADALDRWRLLHAPATRRYAWAAAPAATTHYLTLLGCGS